MIKQDNYKYPDIPRGIQLLMDKLPFFILLIDNEHNIYYANNAVAKFLNKSHGEIQGKYCPMLIHGKKCAVDECTLEKSLRTGTWSNTEYKDERSGRWLKTFICPTDLKTNSGKKLYYHTARDITEQKAVLQDKDLLFAIEEITSRILRVGLENIPLEKMLNRMLYEILDNEYISLVEKGYVFLVEEEGFLHLAAAKNMPSAVRKVCSEIKFGQCLCGRAAKRQELIFTDHINEEHDTSYEGIKPHGHYIVPLILEGETAGVLCFYTKPGEQRDEKKEKFLRAVADVITGIIKHTKTEAALLEKEKLAGVGQMTAGIVHELNNSLTAMIPNIELLEEDIREIIPDESKEDLSQLRKGALRMKKMLSSILSYSRVSDRKEPGYIHINDIIEETLELLSPVIKKSKAEIKKSLSEVPRLRLPGDKIIQVFVNLIKNSLQALDKQENPVIEIETSYESSDNRVVIKLTDNGEGIEEKKLAKIFQPFYSTKPKGKGTGLGLSIVSDIIKSLEGTIDVQSQIGEFTRLIIKFPA